MRKIYYVTLNTSCYCSITYCFSTLRKARIFAQLNKSYVRETCFDDCLYNQVVEPDKVRFDL